MSPPTEPSKRSARAALDEAASLRLDLLRGVAALLVCSGHLRNLFLQDFGPVGRGRWLQPFYLATGLGHQAVMLFFVLSGYLVGGAALREFSAGTFSWRRYLAARLTRLWLVLLPALALTEALDRAGPALFGAAGAYSGDRAFGNVVAPHSLDNLGALTLLGNALFVQTVRVAPLGTNGALWSLANEAWYYLLFPAALTACFPGSALRRLAALAATAGMLAFVGRELALYMLPWLLGAGVSWLQARAKPERAWHPRVALTATAALLLSLLATKVLHGGVFALDLLVSSAMAWWLLATVRARPLLSLPRPVASAARFLSDISFTLYVTHLPLAVLLAASRGPLPRLAPDARGLALYAAALALLLVCARALWWCFEARTESVRRRVLGALGA